DVDLSDKPASAIVPEDTVVTPTLANGYQLTQAQHDALVSAFVIDPATFDSGTGTGSIGWHYNIADSALDFLGKNDKVVLNFTVQVDDLNGGTDQQTVAITVHGAEDAPVITSSAQSGMVAQEARPQAHTIIESAGGTITFSDADLSDKPTGSIVVADTT